MEQIKEAFSKVKQDIEMLKNEIFTLNKKLVETRESLVEICEILKNISKKKEEVKKEEIKIETPTQAFQLPTQAFQLPTQHIQTPTDNKFNMPQRPQKAKNLGISTGNEGVPTDRQTDQQTDQQTDKGSYNLILSQQKSNTNSFPISSINPPILNTQKPPTQNSIDNAVQILESLDNLKKEIRLKFKRLTNQEFLVFSTIYQSSEETGYTDYKNLSEKLNLTESSIRDYIGRLIKKGIPVEKIKINNKTIHLSIAQNFKKIASLPTILQLRSI
jgi:DNA-binding MarR family transcriptional regulator